MTAASPTIVFFPGFATDERLLSIPYPSWNIISLPPSHTIQEDWNAIQSQLMSPYTIIGFSMGVDMALKCLDDQDPNLKEILLFGARPQYTRAEIKLVKTYLIKDYTNYLEQFYKACFKTKKPKFWPELEKNYLKKFNLEKLLKQLDLVSQINLSKHKIPAQAQFIHGENDQIAPLPHIQSLIPQDQLTIIKNAEHIDVLYLQMESIKKLSRLSDNTKA